MPDNGYSGIVNDEARPGSDIVYIKWAAFLSPITSKVCIHPTIKQMSFKGHYEPFVMSTQQVLANSEYCLSMCNLWGYTESCTLVDCITNVRAYGFLQKVQLANNTLVVPSALMVNLVIGVSLNNHV